ncbi:cysteine--tRNA ligase [Propylenella binzhouense]|uniref:Cysteine--tRNA ligase n=1 Tax=Propylenella binzhouense TaxID=2555902 RepID=A0A964WSY8_9HYPH|nr:cysteine--tRNA ligase [Propylenella binzhouense]MYZ47467.1 cysteine--tRNA ligase [Propylenella binzhouense]
MGEIEAFRGVRLHNTLTRRKEDFVPFDPADVRMYVCGPTVYDYAHIGNARPVIVFDVLYRLLRHLYGAEHVTYVRNVTDVDDKINARAAEEFPDLPLNEAIRKVTEKTEAQFHADMDALGALRPSHEPRATEHIEGMKRMIEKLVARGNAYVAADHVLFDVPSMPDYGRLSGRSLDEMLAGARVDVAPYKRDPMDFVLWKPSKPGEPAWPSPCGIAAPGRPGWHIECSAMAEAHLGTEFDIHGGGIDLVFPHHENEIAQSRCAHAAPLMARYWLHNGFLQVEGEKMSKSLGNFVTVHELLKDWPGEVIRLNMLKTHYRQPIDWTVKGLEESRKVLDRWHAACGDAEPWTGENPVLPKLLAPLLDDLNTPLAIATLHHVAEEAADDHDGDDRAMFRAALGLLGLGGLTASEWESRRRAGAGVDEALVESLIARRVEARSAKNWVEADRLRAEIEALGVAVMDKKDPGTGRLVTTWEPKR